MKKLYSTIGLLIIVVILMVGCSSEDPATNETDESQSVQTEKDIEETEDKEDIEEPIEEEEEAAEEFEGEIKSKVLRDMMNSDQYTMKMRRITNMNGEELEGTVTTVVSGDQTATLTESDGMELNVIEKGDKTYVIMHDSKMIVVSDRYEKEDEIDIENIDLVSDELEYVGKGNGTFLGKQRSYEEYKMKLGRVIYYFDGKELDGMEMFIDMTKLIDEEDIIVEDINIIMDIESFEKDVDMSLFELPEGYQVVGE